MIDWHCHILPGIDDGAPDVAVAVAMARLLSQSGITEVYCTPHHITGLYPNTPEQVRAAVRELQAHLDRDAISLQLHPAMEYYLDEYFLVDLNDPLTLGESNRLLVEIPSQVRPDLVREALARTLRKGLIPVIAHPERSRLLETPPARGFWQRLLGGGERGTSTANALTFDELRAMGCLFQGNLGAFAGYYGPAVQQRAEAFATAGHYACFGSDGHNAVMLKNCLTSGLAAVNRLQPDQV